jgi:hypothetical protein
MSIAHPSFKPCPSAIFDYQLKHTFVLDRTLLIQALAIIPHLSLGVLSGMVYEHFLGCFILEDSSSRFSELSQVVTIVARGNIPKLVALVLGVDKLLAMTKGISGLHFITMSKVFF